MTGREQLLDELRPVALSLAYRSLGRVFAAEDVVQEALLRVHRALVAGEQIASPRAFVAPVTTRLAINELRSARVRREHYVGDWLPEPIITDGGRRGGDWLPEPVVAQAAIIRLDACNSGVVHESSR
jgi:RNA polymerase sigma-70 factor (ECF subfamily)